MSNVDVWRYSSKNGKNSKISVTKCSMAEKDAKDNRKGFRFSKIIRFKKNGHKCVERVPCNEGDIVQGVMWLYERDDQRAIELFRQNALERINTLERLIEGRKKFINDIHIGED